MILANQYLEEFSKRFAEFTGTNSLNNVESISTNLYPNPTNGFLRIDSNVSEALDMSIFDATGNLVFESRIESSTQEFSFSFEAGVYFVQLKSENLYTTHKLILN